MPINNVTETIRFMRENFNHPIVDDAIQHMIFMRDALKLFAHREIKGTHAIALHAQEVLKEAGEWRETPLPIVEDAEVPLDEIHFRYKDGTVTKFRIADR